MQIIKIFWTNVNLTLIIFPLTNLPQMHGYKHISKLPLCRPHGALMKSYVSFYKDVVTTWLFIFL